MEINYLSLISFKMMLLSSHVQKWNNFLIDVTSRHWPSLLKLLHVNHEIKELRVILPLPS